MTEISADLYKELLDRMSDGVFFVDMNLQVMYWNEGATQLTGYTAEDIVGQSCRDSMLCHENGARVPLGSGGCPLADCVANGESHEGEYFLVHKLGRRVPVNVRVQPIREADGTIVGAVEIFRDNAAQIEVRRKAEVMERLAFLDPLTHHPNRRFLEMSLRTALVEFQAPGDPFGVLIFDVDQFKRINDHFGHAGGDRALCEVSKTLTGALRGNDIVGRWAGDEFLAIVHNVNREMLDRLGARCTAMVAGMTFANNTGGQERLSISVGAALVQPEDDVATLVARADGRMYTKKKADAASGIGVSRVQMLRAT